jgi:hypothetical protein
MQHINCTTLKQFKYMCKIRSVRKVTYIELFFSTTIHCRTTAHTVRLRRVIHEADMRVDRPNADRRAHCHRARLRVDVELRPGTSVPELLVVAAKFT